VYRCPSDPVPPIDAALAFAGPRISYVANGYWGWYGRNEMSGLMGRVESHIAENVARLSSLTKPAETIMLTERAAVYPNAVTERGPFYNWGMYVVINGQDTNAWIPDGTRAPKADPYDATGPNGAVTAIHFEQANFLFADGHVKSMKPTATNPNGAGNRATNMWDGKRP
jgi:prepilin-type processing-associated H-X9-DG protein